MQHNSTVIMRLLFALLGLMFLPSLAVAQEQSRPAELVQETVQDVLNDAEFRHLREPRAPEPAKDSAWAQWWSAFWTWLFGKSKPRSAAAPVSFFAGMSLLLFAVVIIVLVVLLVLLIIALLKLAPAATLDTVIRPTAGDQDALTPSTPPGDLPTNEYERRAVLAAQSGDFRTAIRELVLGSMSWTERAGCIRYRKGLTNRDYIRAVWRQTERRDSLLAICGAFERVFFGRRAADAPTFETCLAEFRKSFSLEPAHAPLAG